MYRLMSREELFIAHGLILDPGWYLVPDESLWPKPFCPVEMIIRMW